MRVLSESATWLPIFISKMTDQDNKIYTKLAREAIELYLKEKKVLEPASDLPEELTQTRKGVFVSLYNKTDHQLRGCIGTFLPTRKDTAEGIIYNAISAATEDPRFPPVKSEELPKIEISVDILSEPKIVTEAIALDTKKYGLILSTTDGRRGLLLPDLEGIDTVEEQEKICRLKAGIEPNETVTRHFFSVERHLES